MDQVPVYGTREVDAPPPHRANAIVENARREFANAFSDLARGKRNWQVAAFALAGAVALEAVAIIALAGAARVVPYVVRVDQVGRVEAVGPASPMRDPNRNSPISSAPCELSCRRLRSARKPRSSVMATPSRRPRRLGF